MDEQTFTTHRTFACRECRMTTSADRKWTVRSFVAPLLVASLTVGGAIALAGCEKKVQADNAAARPTTFPVTVSPVVVQDVKRTVDVVGTLFADEETTVSAKVPGRIIKLYKDIGDAVQPGEPLVQLKPNDYQLNVAKAKLAMEQALAKIGLKELPAPGYDPDKVLANVPSVVKAKVEAENAQERLNRNQKLFEAKPPLISEERYADLQTALRVAKSEYDVAALAASATLAEAWAYKGDLDIAAQRLNDATTRAPSPADPKDLAPSASLQSADAPPAPKRVYRVTHRYVNEGELVREITPCFRLVDDSRIKLRARVPERFVGQIKVGQRATATVDAWPGVEFVGQVTRVNPQVEENNRTFGIEILIPNDDRKLKPGSFAKAAVETRTDPKVVFAPKSAVIVFAGVSKVFKIGADDKATEVRVGAGDPHPDDPNLIEITSGLKGDERLVTSGATRLATGVQVKVNATPATGPTSRPDGGEKK